jgi:hypothetical protein
VTFVETIPEDEATGEVAAIYEESRTQNGFVQNFVQAFSLRPEVLAALPTGLDEADRAVMELAEQVVDDATSITEGDIDRLRTLGLSDGEIVDVVLAAAARCFFSKTLDALGAEPDSAFAGLDPVFLDALVVGRPIAAAP